MSTILYTSSTCKYCPQVKSILQSSGITYEERNVSTDGAARTYLVEKMGIRSVPVLVHNNKTYIGYDEIARVFVL